jgi:hypothetical protein
MTMWMDEHVSGAGEKTAFVPFAEWYHSRETRDARGCGFRVISHEYLKRERRVVHERAALPVC